MGRGFFEQSNFALDDNYPNSKFSKVDPKSIERLEGDWEYRDSPEHSESKKLFWLRRLLVYKSQSRQKALSSELSDSLDYEAELNPFETQNKQAFYRTKVALKHLVLLPTKLILSPLGILSLFHFAWLRDEEADPYLSNFEKASGRFYQFMVLPLAILLIPFKFFFTLVELLWGVVNQKKWEAIYILPSLLMVSLFAYVLTYQILRAHRIEDRYSFYATVAMENNDYPKAKTFFKRLLQLKTLQPQEQFQWAIILSKTGEAARAEEIINKLAPENSVGLSIAHRLKALSISSMPDVNKRLGSLLWHLNNCENNSPEINLAWAKYHIAIQEPCLAAENIEIAALKNPLLYESLSKLYLSINKKTESDFALQKADNALREHLRITPLDHTARIGWASVNAQLGNHTKAEKILLQGRSIKTNSKINRALSDFYLFQCDRAMENASGISNQLSLLQLANKSDPSYGAVYARMMKLFVQDAESQENKRKIKEALLQNVTSNSSSPIAHFALSNILLQEGNEREALHHLEQAYRMDRSLVSVANNIAWILAHSENPNLDRALNLASAAVKQAPRDTRCRDTLGTILMKLGRYEEAATELQLALTGVKDKRTVHSKLATIYTKLKMTELAKIHLQKSVN